MNKSFLLIMTISSVFLTACDSGGKKIVDTKDGVIVTTVTGDIYKVVGTELYEIKSHDKGYEEGYLKSIDYDIPSKNAKLHVSLKAKIFNDKTDYVIKVDVVENSITDKNITKPEVLKISNGNIDGISSLIINFEDAEGFSAGKDVIGFDDDWTNIVNDKDETLIYEFKGMRASEKLRANKNTSLRIQWKSTF